jgi:molecular chaperone GrpE
VSDVEIKTQGDGEEAEGVEASSAEAEEAREPSELEQLAAERDKLKDQLLRTAADFDNFRKRSRKDLEQAERRGREEVLREVLPIIDNLERAVAAASDATDVEAVRDGVQMVLKGFEDTASRIGLERIESVGQRFDPNLHDAFQQQETAEHPPGTIVAEYQPGYKLGDKLLRPAMVVVARKPPEPAPDGGE